MSVARKILNNTLYNVAGRIWVVLANLFLTPLILGYLGTERFAVWALFWAFSNYFMLIDFGLSVALVRTVAGVDKQHRERDLNRALSSTFFFYLGIGSALVIIAWSIGPWLIQVSGVSAVMMGDVQSVILWGTPVFCLIGIVHVFDAFLSGHQRFDLTNAGMVFISCVNVAGTYIVLKQGWAINGLLGSTAFVYVCQILLYAFFSFRIFPQMRVSFRYFHYATLRNMLPFGSKIQVTRIAEIISTQADKVLLAYFVPLKFVTFYDLGAKLSTVLKDVPYMLTYALFPAASKEYADGNHVIFWKMYERGNKYLLTLTVPMLIGMFLTSHLLIGAWLGHVPPYVHKGVLFLSVSYWIVGYMSTVFNIGTAAGWAKTIMHGAVFQAVLNITLSCLLIWQFGFEGALAGTLISIALSQLYVRTRFYMDFEYPFKKDATALFRAFIVNVPAALICAVYVDWADHWVIKGQRMDSFLALMTAIFIYIVAYLISIRIFRYFDKEDLNLLKGHFPVMSWLVHLK